MKTMEDQFDAKLTAAFTRANANIVASPDFIEQLRKRLGRANRQRWMVLASAASVGALIAGSQLQQIATNLSVQTGWIAQVFAILPPTVITSMMLAAIMAVFGLVLPATNR